MVRVIGRRIPKKNFVRFFRGPWDGVEIYAWMPAPRRIFVSAEAPADLPSREYGPAFYLDLAPRGPHMYKIWRQRHVSQYDVGVRYYYQEQL